MDARGGGTLLQFDTHPFAKGVRNLQPIDRGLGPCGPRKKASLKFACSLHTNAVFEILPVAGRNGLSSYAGCPTQALTGHLASDFRPSMNKHPLLSLLQSSRTAARIPACPPSVALRSGVIASIGQPEGVCWLNAKSAAHSRSHRESEGESPQSGSLFQWSNTNAPMLF